MRSERRHYERIIYVNLSCNKERVDEREVEFVDICEDFEGRDRLTFVCPECKKHHTSLRFG
jgi:hypothetical protein